MYGSKMNRLFIALIFLAPGVTPVSGRHGTYNITVTSPGYQDWTRNGVLVKSADSCGQPESVNVTADLQPRISP